MEKLICNMIKWAGTTEEQLKEKKSISTDFGETLSWEYLTYVRSHRISKWDVPTSILYGTTDHLTEKKNVEAFSLKHQCKLTLMDGGEHWFHTPEQLKVLAKWEKEGIMRFYEQ